MLIFGISNGTKCPSVCKMNMILNFLCRTTSQDNLWEIKRMCYAAGADIVNESVGDQEFILEVSSYRGFLYKSIKASGLCDLEIRITDGIRKTKQNK